MPQPGDLRARLSGRLVTLEPLAREHGPGLREAAAADPEVFAWMPVDLGDPDTHDAWLAASLDAANTDRDVPFAILDAQTAIPIGSSRFLEIRLEHLRVEIGWTWMAKRTWGTGANVEAKLLLLTHAFERVGVRRVEFKTDARNERSRGALTALGTTFEGIFRKHMVVQHGAPRDSAYYSVIDDEWPAVKAAIETRLAGA
jgi:N-acetyltransferase